MKIQIHNQDYHYYMFDSSEKDALDNIPWGSAGFDVLIPILDKSLLTNPEVTDTIDKLVSMNTDWFETLGHNSEWLHDEIDIAGVRVGKQKAVGDGFPMTVWHDDAITIEDMTDHIHYPRGGYDYKLVYILGDSMDLRRFVAEFYKQRHK